MKQLKSKRARDNHKKEQTWQSKSEMAGWNPYIES
jgi:hypothetical protein